MIQIISWIWLFSGVILIILVLLHSPKGDGMGVIAAVEALCSTAQVVQKPL